MVECLHSIYKAPGSVASIEKENGGVVEWVVMTPFSEELTLKLGPKRQEGGSYGRVQGKNRAAGVKMPLRAKFSSQKAVGIKNQEEVHCAPSKGIQVVHSVATFRLNPWCSTSSTEQFAVRSSTSRQVVTVGAQTEFSCQLSPPQSALHMKVGWFRNQSSQLVYLHENGEEHSRESSRNYVNHTLFLKDALGEGKISLRIYNISIFDGGLYQCFFEDGDTYEEATVDLRVAGKAREKTSPGFLGIGSSGPHH